MENLLFGRELLWHELPVELQADIQQDKLAVTIKNSYHQKNKKLHCRRCQQLMTTVQAHECRCQKTCAYCRHCLPMGKVRKCAHFYSLPEPNEFPQPSAGAGEKLLAWTGELSPQQAEAATAIITSIQQQESRLLWAVAGAGKTEMLFPGLEYAFQRQLRVCLASPRIDVCLELAPRLAAAFPTVPYALLYGEMDAPYAYRQLTIATTHQLFRFQEAFDLLIIDEIDAFPFDNDEALQTAAQKAKKAAGTVIYLSATPNRTMQKEVKAGQLASTILPARYHGYPLPLPRTKWCSHWQTELLSRFARTSFGKIFAEKIKQQQKFLVFVPNIDWMLTFEKQLRKWYPTLKFASVSAADGDRKEKVLQMRAGAFDFLMTTTILERGVTFPNIDVLVIGAEDRIYTEAALVQIAGRCGRAAAFPTGDVVFFHAGQTLAMKRARQQIRRMNQLARERGLLA